MALGKWIGGFLGFMSAGPLGALAGIVLGGLFDSMLDAVNTPETQGTFDGQSGFESQTYGRQQAYEGQRNEFPVLHAGAGFLHHQGRRQGDAL